MNCSLPGPLSVGIFQARTLEWAYPSSRRSSQPKDQTQVSHIAGRFFIIWAIREAQEYWSGWPISSPRDLPNPRIKIKSLTHQVKWKSSVMSTLCDPMDYTVHGILQARILEWAAFPFSRGSSNPGITPRSPALWAESSPAEPQGKPKNTGMGSLSLLQQIFPTQESNQSLLHCRQILYQLSYERSPTHLKNYLNSHFSNRISGLYSLTKCHYVMLCYAKSLQ